MNTLLYETDWLASTPVFYDQGRRLASNSIHELTPADAPPVFHPEGLYNFLDFGYSVLEQTPLEGIRFLRHSSRLWRTAAGVLEVEELDDPFDRYDGYRLSESDVVELIRDRVQTWEAALPPDQEIVLPLSGGFDSRLLLWCIRDKSRVRAFTYGISDDQDRSTEVVHARTLAQRFGLHWERIPLGDFHRYFDPWDAEFGLSTHAHGMYHFEFYTRIRERLTGQQAFLSGIIGDAWAGSIPARKIEDPEQLTILGYTHGLRADQTRLRLTVHPELRERYWAMHRERLADHRYQVVTSMRFKLMLLSYLMRIPHLFGFAPWTPYLDIDIAMAMLNLPPERRANRQWQQDFFARVGLDLEGMPLGGSYQNTLDLQALRRIPVPSLDSRLLGDIVDSGYVDWINRQLSSGLSVWRDEGIIRLLRVRKVGRALRRLGVTDPIGGRLTAYNAYLVLLPIQRVLERWNQTFRP